MIDFSDIVIPTIREDEIHEQLYRHNFPEYMHMIHSRTIGHVEGYMVCTFRSYCEQAKVFKAFDRDRYQEVSGFHKVDFIPGFTERTLDYTNDFVLVTCPRCLEDYPLDLLSKT